MSERTGFMSEPDDKQPGIDRYIGGRIPVELFDLMELARGVVTRNDWMECSAEVGLDHESEMHKAITDCLLDREDSMKANEEVEGPTLEHVGGNVPNALFTRIEQARGAKTPAEIPRNLWLEASYVVGLTHLSEMQEHLRVLAERRNLRRLHRRRRSRTTQPREHGLEALEASA